MAGKGSAWRSGANRQAYNNSPYWEKREQAKLIERWRKLLDLIKAEDEYHTATILEDISTAFFKAGIEEDRKLIIPVVARLMGKGVEVNFDPDFKAKKPVKFGFNDELAGKKEIFGISVEQEMFDISCLEFFEDDDIQKVNIGMIERPSDEEFEYIEFHIEKV